MGLNQVLVLLSTFLQYHHLDLHFQATLKGFSTYCKICHGITSAGIPLTECSQSTVQGARLRQSCVLVTPYLA